MKRKSLGNQGGDTIIEVIIALAVLAITIAGAYGIASRSLKAGRQAQERDEATKLAESQLENIKAQAVAGNAALFSSSNFCFNPGITTTDCRFNNLYDVSITSAAASSGNNVYQFDVTVQWDSITHNGKDQVIMRYRVINEG